MEFRLNLLDLAECDLACAFHGVRIAPGGNVFIEYEELSNGKIRPIYASCYATMEDLIDYAYYKGDGTIEDTPVRQAAECQIGYNRRTGRNAGGIFLVKVNLMKQYMNPSFLPDIQP